MDSSGDVTAGWDPLMASDSEDVEPQREVTSIPAEPDSPTNTPPPPKDSDASESKNAPGTDSSPPAAAAEKTSSSTTIDTPSTEDKSPRTPRRGHNRQRSASWSAVDAAKFVQEAAGSEGSPRQRAKSPLPLFAGVAPDKSDESHTLIRHSYTPQKPVQSSVSSIDLVRYSSQAMSSPKVERQQRPLAQSMPARSRSRSLSACGAADDLVLAERLQVSMFLKKVTCYHMMPESGKIVVFDTQLLVKKAFFALVQHGMRAGILWDSSAQQYVGMITITDFIHILRKYYVSPLVQIDELEDHKIETWRVITDNHLPRTLLSIDPHASLYDAAQTLLQEGVHRLPAIDGQSGNALTILTVKRILWFMRASFPWDQCPTLMNLKLRELNIGCTKNVAAVSPDTPLISVLNIFVERNISALPIIDSDGKVIDIYVKYDAITLAERRTYNNLDIAVTKALEERHKTHEGVQTCTLDDTLTDMIERIYECDVTRLIIVDKQMRLIGILTISDILSVFLLREKEEVSVA